MKLLTALLVFFLALPLAAQQVVIREAEMIRRLDKRRGSSFEWAVVQMCNGRFAEFKGKRDSVQIPRGVCAVAFGHNHPKGNPANGGGRMPSATDLENAKRFPSIVFYVRGSTGIISRIVGTDFQVIRQSTGD